MNRQPDINRVYLVSNLPGYEFDEEWEVVEALSILLKAGAMSITVTRQIEDLSSFDKDAPPAPTWDADDLPGTD